MNKATVFQVGNRLSKTMPRREAFIQAWQICRAGGLTLPLRGVTVGSRQEALRRLAKYEPEQVHAFLLPEPSNPVDKNALAVMVMVQNGPGVYRLGYIPAKDTAKAAAVQGKASLRIVSGS